MPNIYCLLLPQATRTAINHLRTGLFQKTGSPSFRTLPPCIILGKTENTFIPSGLHCPDLPLAVNPKAMFAEGQLFFPIEEQKIRSLQNQLGTSYPISGIFLGKQEQEIEQGIIPQVDDLRLALLEYKEAEGLTLWKILSEKHLQKDKG
jgi:hypothetical protein